MRNASSVTLRTFVVGLGLSAVGLYLACSEPGECLRHSDCDKGRVCDNGACIVQTSPEAGATDGAVAVDSGIAVTPDAGHVDAGVDSGAAADAGADAEVDAGVDAGEEVPSGP